MRKLYILLSLTIFCSCNVQGSYMEHFISGYYTYNNIDLSVVDVYDVAPNDGNDYQWITVFADADDIYRYNETQESRKQIYNQLAEKYGDIGYDRNVEGATSNRSLFAIENISSIELTCLEDIDTEHPAGSSIADMFIFDGESPIEYIQSGYTSKFRKVINKKLEDIESADLILLGKIFYDPCLFYLFPIEQQNCPAWGKKLRLTLNYENQYPISKDFILEEGEY